MRPHPTILGFALAAAVASACGKPATVVPDRASRARRFVQALADTQLRDAAYCELLSLGLYRRSKDAYQDTCGPVSEVVTAPQEGSSPLYIVFTKPEYEIERERIRRGPAGPYTLFDSYGYIIPVFASANLLDHESEVFPYSPSGKIAIASVFGVSSGSAFDEGRWSVQTLNIVPATAVQTSALSVVLGPPTFGFDDQCAGDFWSWRHDDADGDG